MCGFQSIRAYNLSYMSNQTSPNNFLHRSYFFFSLRKWKQVEILLVCKQLERPFREGQTRRIPPNDIKFLLRQIPKWTRLPFFRRPSGLFGLVSVRALAATACCPHGLRSKEVPIFIPKRGSSHRPRPQRYTLLEWAKSDLPTIRDLNRPTPSLK